MKEERKNHVNKIQDLRKVLSDQKVRYRSNVYVEEPYNDLFKRKLFQLYGQSYTQAK